MATRSSAKTKPRTIRVSFRDVVQRRAFLRIPAEGKVKLAHMAGAPWSEVNADAELSEPQQDIVKRPERTAVIHGGTGLGKSMMAGLGAAIAAMLPFQRVAFVGDVFDHVGKEFRYCYLFFVKLFGRHQSAFTRIIYRHQKNYHDYEVSTIWGTKVFGLSMDHAQGQTALGEFLHWMVLCEGSQIGINVLNKRILRASDRALQRRPGCTSDVRETGHIRAFTTPDQMEGSAAELVELAKARTNQQLEKLHYGRVPFVESFFFIEAKSTMNPQFSVNAMAHRAKTMDAHTYGEVYEGKAAPASGRIYKFEQGRHIVPFPPVRKLREMRFGLGFDTGAVFACLLYGLDRDRKGWALAETYEKKQTIDVCCTKVREMLESVFCHVLGYDDVKQAITERIELAIIDPASQFKLDIMEHIPELSLSNPYRDEGEFDLLPTIQQMQSFVGNDQECIVEDCVHALEEARKYIWQSRPSPARKGYFLERKPIDDFNHWCDAWRYIAIPMHQLGPLDSPAQAMDDFATAWDRQVVQQVTSELGRIMQAADEAGPGGIPC